MTEKEAPLEKEIVKLIERLMIGPMLKEVRKGEVLDKREAKELAEKLISLPEDELKMEDLLKTDIMGTPVAYYMAEKGYVFTKKEFLKIKSYIYETSVAHVMVTTHMWEFNDEEILSIVDALNWSVAHEMAWHGLNRYLLDKPSILSIRDILYGLTVEDIIIDRFLQECGRPIGAVRDLSPEERERVKRAILLTGEVKSVKENIAKKKDLNKRELKI